MKGNSTSLGVNVLSHAMIQILRVASFHRFNCALIIPILLDKVEFITRNSTLISFIPETFNIVRTKEI